MLDWQLEISIIKFFDECGGMIYVLWFSWLFDGYYLVFVYVMNNLGFIVQIIEWEGWKINMDFVGYWKVVIVVKFNLKIFKKKQKNGSFVKFSCLYCCCVVGSKDCLFFVWFICLKWLLVVIYELFDKFIMDIFWILNGLGILVCFMDGFVVFFDFFQDEFGDFLSEEEKSCIYQFIYGKSLVIMIEVQFFIVVIENFEMFKY